MKDEKTKKIIFVCTGNTCRSPMAEALFRSELKRLHIDDIAVLSAGLSVAKNDGLNPNSAIALSENGLTLDNFQSKQLTEDMIENAYAVICMTEKQRQVIEEKLAMLFFASAGKKSYSSDKIHSFYSLVGYDVPDPFGRDLNCYRFVFQKLSEGMQKICQKLNICPVGESKKQCGEIQKPTPKKRGRPRKNPDAPTDKTPSAPKKRGRPRKNPDTNATNN